MGRNQEPTVPLVPILLQKSQITDFLFFRKLKVRFKKKAA